MHLLSKLAYNLYPPILRRLEKNIGCRLIFSHIPDRYINGIFSGTMTGTWKRFGLDIEKGLNHWTMGHIVNGKSTRFDRTAPEYQSWLGGYTVRLSSERMLTPEDHFKLAQADQNGWLRMYGDPQPKTTIDNWKSAKLDTIACGKYQGTLYELGCTTHSDVGARNKSLWLSLGCHVMAMIFNAYNRALDLKASAFLPKPPDPDKSYEVLDLKGFIAIFEVAPKIRVVLYANGVIPGGSFTKDTLTILKDDLLKTMRSCEIIEV